MWGFIAFGDYPSEEGDHVELKYSTHGAALEAANAFIRDDHFAISKEGVVIVETHETLL